MPAASTTVRTRTRTWSSVVRLADPKHEQEQKKELVYEFSNGRTTKRYYEREPYRSEE